MKTSKSPTNLTPRPQDFAFLPEIRDQAELQQVLHNPKRRQFTEILTGYFSQCMISHQHPSWHIDSKAQSAYFLDYSTEKFFKLLLENQKSVTKSPFRLFRNMKYNSYLLTDTALKSCLKSAALLENAFLHHGRRRRSFSSSSQQSRTNSLSVILSPRHKITLNQLPLTAGPLTAGRKQQQRSTPNLLLRN